jgi:hypothetical protein
MKNSITIQRQSFIKKKSLIIGMLAVFSMFFIILQSCTKETPEPDIPSGGNSGSSGNGGSNITQVDVNGLKQNFINAEGITKVQLTRTLVEAYDSGNDKFTKMTYQGEGNTTITIIVKGS